jgi:UBX domain-containing protein 1/4
MLKRVDTINLRNPPKRCVCPFFFFSWLDADEVFKIKPLTEEEKKQKLAELREKMDEKRAKKAEEEAKEARANELIRRKAGKVRAGNLLTQPPSFLQKRSTNRFTKQEATQIKEDLKNKQILKDLEAKRRGSFLSLSPLSPSANSSMIFAEKEDDKKARAAIKAQIEADKRDRAQKAAQEKALRDGAAAAPSVAPPASAAPTTPSVAVAGRDFKETRLQIRLASGGQPLTTTLSSDASCVSPSLPSYKSFFFCICMLKIAAVGSNHYNSPSGSGGICRWSDFDGGR